MSKSKLEGTKTIQNLINSFAGESQARNRYTMFASIAEKEGYAQIKNVFLETADNERLHGKAFYEQIAHTYGANEVVELKVNGSYPVVIGDTLTNLKIAAKGEHEEFAVLYSQAAIEAEKEGFDSIAFLFSKIADIEAEHERRYLAFAKAIETGTMFKKDHSVKWKCAKCGHIHSATTAPKVCPVCNHPQGYFEVDVYSY